jgi:cyclopropane fatty-acyl-phospholipid synthase-like methyltransferase
MLKDRQDAFGHSMYDYLNGIKGAEVTERDDGSIAPGGGPAAYFAEYRKWHPLERKAMRYVRGRVLDVGCGAGRHSLYLQEKGHDVAGIDNSPLAIEVCKRRGLKDARLISLSEVGPALGVFDTVMMLGNNFGLFGTAGRAKRLLRRFHKMTSEKGRIVATSVDPYKTDDADHLAYQAANRAKGRMSGQIRLRLRYKRYAMPWIDLLIVSRQEMERIVGGTGWVVSKYLGPDAAPYVAIIEKKRG